MSRPADEVDRALESLGGRMWPGDPIDPKLESELMSRFDNASQPSLFARHRVLVPVIGVLIAASVGFAGVAIVQSWLVTTTVDGEVVGTQEVLVSEDGQASFTVPIPELEEGTHVVELEIDGESYDADGTQKTIEVTLGDDNNAVVDVKTEPATEEPAESSADEE